MRSVIDIIQDIPSEDIKALVSAGVMRRNTIRETQAIAHYKNRRAAGCKAADACEQAASKYGMSSRTLWRVIKLYGQ